MIVTYEPETPIWIIQARDDVQYVLKNLGKGPTQGSKSRTHHTVHDVRNKKGGHTDKQLDWQKTIKISN